ncbi:MAG TPA: glycoside hydrolase family 28 protein [Vicinamibacterales bacterium]|jgi:polygalacturonase|nr:glycoside hydrolase family 28 protein [Vicinamibacterales bacterium]
MTDRRAFLKTLAASAVAGSWRRSATLGAQSRDDPWRQLPAILARIRPPTFARRDFELTAFGGVGDNARDNTDAFRQAIAACVRAGGGRVVVPNGEFLTAAIELKSGVNLHLTSEATIRFTRDATRYPTVLTRWEGVELMNFSPFIYAFEQRDIGLTGSGTIDGGADCTHWWPWKGRSNCGWARGDVNQEADRNTLFEMSERGVPVADRVFGPGHYLRPQLIQPYRCSNVLIEGVKLRNSPMWQVHPVLCTNVTVRDLNIQASVDGPNTDGCDPESCRDVLISNCFFDTGDDCIAIKAGRNADGRRVTVPSENIVIQKCHMRNGHGGITIGSEASAGVRNVFAEDCRLDSPRLEIAVRIKNNAMRGNVIENVFARRLDIGQVAQAVLGIDFYYEEGDKGGFTPTVRRVALVHVKATKAAYALHLRGFASAPIRDVSLVDCQFGGVAQANIVEHVEGLSLQNVRVNGKLVT